MKIAVLGVGSLGSVYASRLSKVASVELVVRTIDAAPRSLTTEWLVGAGTNGSTTVTLPTSTLIAEDADVVLVSVRVDQVDDALLEHLARGPQQTLVVVLTPLLPHRLKAARQKLGERLVVAMPGVIAYEPQPAPNERRIRYWTPRATPTVIEDRAEGDARRASIAAFVETLQKAGLACELSRRIAGANAATIIAFFPMLTGLVASGGSVDRMLDDRPLLELGLSAAKESRAIAKALGDLPGWTSLFFGFMTPWTVRAGIKLGRSRAPEAITFLEQHFGTKLATQNGAMFREIEALANERGLQIDSLRQLAVLARAI